MRTGPVAAASVAPAALIALYLALGGATYKPLEVANPCEPRSEEQLREREDALELVVLSALDGAACELRVTREELTLALATPEARAEFATAHHVGEEEIEAAIRGGLERAAEDARRVDAVSTIELILLEQAARRLPLSLLVELLGTEPGTRLLDRLTDLLGEGGVPGG